MDTPIDFPVNGRDDSFSRSRQQDRTTSEAENVRAMDPATGRVQGARRAGSRKACTVALGAGRIQALSTTVYDDRHVTYTAEANPSVEWEQAGTSGKSAFACRYDRYGNLFVIDGGTAALVYNAAGVLTDTIKPPLTPAQVMRALAVDDAGRCYLGVSEGGPQNRARLYAYSKDPYLGWVLDWELNVSGFVEKIDVQGQRVMLAVNDTSAGRAYAVALRTQVGLDPEEEWRSLVPAPVGCLAIAPNGDVAVGSGLNSDRALDPRHPGTGQILSREFASWLWQDIAQRSDREFSDFDPRTLELNEGAPVLEFRSSVRDNAMFQQSTAAVNLLGATARMYAAANITAGTVLTVSLPDGTQPEVYTFVAGAPAAAGEIQIAGTLPLTLANLGQTINSGGDGTAAHIDTEASRYITILALSAVDRTVAAKQTQEMVKLVSSGGNLRFAGGFANTGPATTTHVLSQKTVLPTAPTFKRNGASGNSCVYFDGKSSKMETLPNPNKAAANASQQHTVLPSFGSGGVLGNSARFAAFFVVKPYPTFTTACLFAQANDLWPRRIIANRGSGATSNYTQGQLCCVEKINGTAAGNEEYHAASYQTGGAANLMVVCVISNPTGNYEVYFNDTLAGSGVAAANDGIGASFLGQFSTFNASGVPLEERFAQFELHRIITIRDYAPTGGGPVAVISTAERQLITASLLWEYGAQASLPGGHPYLTVPPPPPGGATTDWYIARKALSSYPIVTKLDRLTGDIAWMAASDGGTNNVSGIGYGVEWNSSGRLYTCGVPVTTPEVYSVRMIVDQGDTYSTAGADGAWAAVIGEESGGAGLAETFSYDRLQLAVDSFDNLYVPFFNDRYAGVPKWYFLFDKLGNLLLSPEAPNAQAVYALDVDRNVPDYTGNATTVDRAQRIGLAARREAASVLTFSGLPADGSTLTFGGQLTPGAAITTEAVTFVAGVPATADEIQIQATVDATLEEVRDRIRLYYLESGTSRFAVPTALTTSTLTFVGRIAQSATTAVGSGPSNATFTPSPFAAGGTTVVQLLAVSTANNSNPKQHAWFAVCDGIAMRFNASSYTPATVVNSAALDPTARYMQAVSVFGETFIVDGKNAAVWTARTNTLRPFVAVGDGRVPENCRLIENYAGGLFLAAGPDPHNWFLSGTPQPYDWNFEPPQRTDTQAWNGNLGPPGRLSDAITGFCALFDDLGLVFCDHHVYRLTGAPAANGRFDLLSSQIGGAFGRCWALGPSNLPYFWAQQGGLYVVNGGTTVQPVSPRGLERALQDVDLSRFYVRMAWNWRLRGLDIFLCPYNGVNESPRTYFWEASVNAFWEDTRTDSGRDVTDLMVVDADNPDDRLTIMGCRDGFARTWDEAAETDDEAAINSRVVIGPIQANARYETMISNLQVNLEQASGMARVIVYVSDNAATKGLARERYVLRPGVNAPLPVRSCGGFVWIEIQSQSRWVFDSMMASLQTGPYRRVRS